MYIYCYCTAGNVSDVSSMCAYGSDHPISQYQLTVITLHACARGKVIGYVVIIIVVIVVSTKIAISQDVGV